ncbi:MAG: Ppx/GppA family phosphatase [Myxococcota bacterium]|nr:Ppx/GppA family phosphatase [Myxococcota bacterium]
MPKFASIDVGSNASRLLIVEAEGPGRWSVVQQLRAPVRLGHSVFLTGRLDPAAVDELVVAMRTFRAVMEQHQVVAHRAVVTASARDAENADEMLQRVNATGVDLEAIDGTEEARLVKLAVEQRVPLSDKRALLCDLGGGSLELSEVHHDEVRFSTSLQIGTVRLLESFLENGNPVTRSQDRLLTEYLDRMLGPVRESFLRRSYDVVAATGGNFETLAELCPASGAQIPTIDVRKARPLLARMMKMKAPERRKQFGLKADRADVIVPALYVLLALADLARSDAFVAPGVGLKEGLAAELVDKHFRVWDYKVDESQAARAAVQLGRRYHFDEPHATQVDRLAVQLFDHLQSLHRLEEHDRVLLRVAALLHDIGDFVHPAAHHKHTQYIVEHSDVMGISPEHRVLVGCVARYHRRAAPSPKHASFGALGEDDRRRVRKLASLLRLADALDRGHRSKVHQLEVEIAASEVVVRASGREDLSLEAWTAARKSALFEATYRRKVRVIVDA